MSKTATKRRSHGATKADPQSAIRNRQAAVATVQPSAIQGPATVWIPREVEVCPECDGQLVAEICEWETENGKPTWVGVAVSCCKEPGFDQPGRAHCNYQSDWQPILDVVIPWCRSNVRIRNGEGGMAK